MARKGSKHNDSTTADVKQKAPRASRKNSLDTVPQVPVHLQEEQDAQQQDAPAQDAAAQDAAAQDNSSTNNVSTSGESNMAAFKFRKTNTIGQHIYGVEGRAGVILIGKQLIDGEPPAELEIAITLPAVTEREKAAAKPKETAEERKARLAAMTPQEKLDAQEARLQRQAENLAKRKAKLAGAAPVAETPAETPAESM